MQHLAHVRDKLADDVRLVRVLHLHGFGSRHAGEAVAIDPDGAIVAGHLLGGLVDETLRSAPTSAGVLSAVIADPDAEAAGMACGGRADLYVQPISTIDDAAWSAMRDDDPVVITTDLRDGSSRVLTDASGAAGTVGDDARADEQARRVLRSGRSVLEVDDRWMVESFIPPTTVRIIGRAGVGEALAAQAALLGWRQETVDTLDEALVAAERQRSHDALVVLSHDPEVDTPCFAAALAHGRGYLGALGSRGTQEGRRERLMTLGFSPAQVDTIHGPVGLDLGSRTPAETAVAIVAEIIAHRSGRQARSLTDTEGPING